MLKTIQDDCEITAWGTDENGYDFVKYCGGGLHIRWAYKNWVSVQTVE